MPLAMSATPADLDAGPDPSSARFRRSHSAIVCDSVPSGTVPPSTKPSPTRPRRNGQGLFGETWIEGSRGGFESGVMHGPNS